MSSKYLSAEDARRIAQLHTFPFSKMLAMLIRKAEYRIRIIATLKGVSTVWSVPFVYASLPAYDSVSMTQHIAAHLTRKGFRVRLVAPTAIWISWRFKTQPLKINAV